MPVYPGAPKLSARQEAHLVALPAAGGHTISELKELFSITRSTVYRALARGGGPRRSTTTHHRTGTQRCAPAPAYRCFCTGWTVKPHQANPHPTRSQTS